MNTLGSRIRQARGDTSQEAFATKIQVSKGALGFYERDQNLPNSDVILKICSETGVSLEWLMRGCGSMRAGEAPTAEIDPYIDGKTCGCDVDLVMIPRVSARLSAGAGSMETDGDVKGLYAFRSDWILRKGNTKKMVLMDVIGDSMSPEIKNGDMVLIDQSKTQLYGYGYYAVGFGEEIYVKQIHTTPKDIILRSLNPQYDDITVSKMDESTDELRIIGRVIWMGRELA